MEHLKIFLYDNGLFIFTTFCLYAALIFLWKEGALKSAILDPNDGKVSIKRFGTVLFIILIYQVTMYLLFTKGIFEATISALVGAIVIGNTVSSSVDKKTAAGATKPSDEG